MKILVVDDELDYLVLFKRLFHNHLEGMTVEYIEDVNDLYKVDAAGYSAVFCDFMLNRFRTAVDAYAILKSKGFTGRFVIITLVPLDKVRPALSEAGMSDTEVIEKGRSSLLRAILCELKDE